MSWKSREHLESKVSWLDNEVQLANKIADQYTKSLKKVIVSDCDGILTDSKSIYTADGKFAKTYGAYDKEAMEFMLALNWKFVFVTTDKAGAGITEARLTHLEKMSPDMITYHVLGAQERANLVENLMNDNYKVLFVGDSLSDIGALNVATWAATTSNAPKTVKKYCDYVSELPGGSGGFADILLAIHENILTGAKNGSNFFAND